MAALSFLLALCIASIHCADPFAGGDYEAAFHNFKALHQKTYSNPEEEAYRFEVFKKNLDFVNSFDSTTRGFTVKMNKFGDMTGKEFSQFFKGIKSKEVEPSIAPELHATIPASIDWRLKGAVTPVKNQGQCGSDWAFAAIAAVESAWYIKTHHLVPLSEQNLIDCCSNNQGCNGGWIDFAFQYIIENKGVDTAAAYPYEAQPQQCHFTASGVGATVIAWKSVLPAGNETALAIAIGIEPVAVVIDASNGSFQFYSSGIYYEPACSSTALDHAVLAIGYGSTGGNDYWIIKNSWGTAWGMEGYMEMARNRNNNCGIASAAVYPIV